jgi:predicted ATPase/class 3 adenylate cyclase
VTTPSGTVVFLFSDIEGSTRRWERHGEAMRDALRRHDKVMRAEIEGRRGYIFKTIGDAFCAAFWTVRDALEAAAEAQRRLGREDFDAIDGLAVRMAMHAGETDERDGDYFGPALNRTARLLSAGHGGQILLSRVAADLAMQELPGGMTLRHLGTLPLRGLDDPESVYQLMAAELRSDFKALRSLEIPPNNLPRQGTSFVGRREDLARVEALLERGALVTIAGAGGIGKTRLALEVAAGRLPDERDGAWFVDLSAIAAADSIPDAILSALGAPRAPDLAPLDALLGYLEKRELLLLLDNGEHVIAQVAAAAAQVVARCPLVTVLVTSREPLDVASERVYRLESLDLASAMQLFGDRARAVDSSFRIDEKAAPVEEICERLDGIALAVELAAARVRTMPVESLAEHLELRILSGGRDRRPRQQTMRSLIDWSYQLLTAEDRRVLRRCSVMRGFTLGVAAEVCGARDDEAAVFDALASLVDKSLVILASDDGVARYRLLEPIREYAAEKLAEADELADVMRRHAAAFASVLRAAYEEWDRGPGADWLSRMRRDLANFRVALRWSLEDRNDPGLGARVVADATLIFVRLALLAEGIEWCERVLQGGIALPSAVEARLRYGLSMLYSNQGAVKRVLGLALESAALYRRSGDGRGLSRALSQASTRYAAAAAYGEAKATAEEALQLARDSGDRRLLADTLRRCATSFATDGLDRVRALFAESVELFRSLGRDEETARALEWWGQWEAETGDFRSAAERLLEAKRLENSDAAAMYYANNLASFYLAIDEPDRAEPFARESLALAAKARHPILAPAAIAYISVATWTRDAGRAARLLGYARERLRAADWQLVDYEEAMLRRLGDALKKTLTAAVYARLLDEGAALNEDQAVVLALSS